MKSGKSDQRITDLFSIYIRTHPELFFNTYPLLSSGSFPSLRRSEVLVLRIAVVVPSRKSMRCSSNIIDRVKRGTVNGVKMEVWQREGENERFRCERKQSRTNLKVQLLALPAIHLGGGEGRQRHSHLVDHGPQVCEWNRPNERGRCENTGFRGFKSPQRVVPSRFNLKMQRRHVVHGPSFDAQTLAFACVDQQGYRRSLVWRFEAKGDEVYFAPGLHFGAPQSRLSSTTPNCSQPGAHKPSVQPGRGPQVKICSLLSSCRLLLTNRSLRKTRDASMPPDLSCSEILLPMANLGKYHFTPARPHVRLRLGAPVL